MRAKRTPKHLGWRWLTAAGVATEAIRNGDVQCLGTSTEIVFQQSFASDESLAPLFASLEMEEVRSASSPQSEDNVGAADSSMGGTTMLSSGVLLGDSIMISSGITMSDGTVLMTSGVLLGDGVLITDGVLLGEGVLIGDGVIVSDGVVSHITFSATTPTPC